MNRLGRLVFVAILLAGSVHVAALTLPGRALACSCRSTGPEQIGKFADEPAIVVFVGTVVSMSNIQDGSGHTTGVLEFQRVYKGNVPAARVPVVGGGGGDCTMSLSAGQRMITAASIEGGVITPGLCMPFGDPATPEGQALIQAAVAAYGPGAPPRGGAEQVPPAPAADPWLPIILGSVVGAAFVLFAIVILVSRRGRTAA